ncbi:hypothetical protein [Propionibacterium freudenreichii]|uniref:hypothetical protein n=1 Tax=Propionibacterium freudenreichii TaxID=1744 RepID=UPI00254B5061|nr:hypothetical protein [Propionibacterium freudenreichii]
MSKEPSIEEAIERAKRAQEDRINAIRGVGEARQNLADVREVTERELAELQAKITERVREAERADVKAYNAALSAGWSIEELRKIGYSEPEKKKRTRRRSSGRSSMSTTSARPASAPSESGPVDATVNGGEGPSVGA